MTTTTSGAWTSQQGTVQEILDYMASNEDTVTIKHISISLTDDLATVTVRAFNQ